MRILLSVLLAAAFVLIAPCQSVEAEDRPRLVVLVSVDQMSADVVRSVAPHLPKDGGGFAGLDRIGVSFTNAAFRHACTFTGPGHATLSTGTTPSRHGIVGNDWFDVAAGKMRYCCFDRGASGVGSLSAVRDRGPGMLAAPTLGDAMKKAFGRQSKVVSVSWKDRSAILMGGASADVVAWADKRAGVFVSSSRWCQKLPEWLVLFNLGRPMDRYFGRLWERFGPPSAYAGLVDERKFEFPAPKGHRSLPFLVNGGLARPGPKFFETVYGTPFGNEITLELARTAIVAEGLGADQVPDLLCIGFSANDAIGHRCGPGSVEVRDVTLRTDRLLREFVAMLDARVGVGRWSMVVSADHGIAPAPGALKQQGRPAGRGQLMLAAGVAANAALVEKLGPPPVPAKPPLPIARWVQHVDGNGLFLDPAALAKVKGKITRAEACDIVVDAVQEVPGVEIAWSVPALKKGAKGRFTEQINLSLFEGRMPDVWVVFRRGWINSLGNASTHGSPHEHDRRVPLWFVPPSGRRERWQLGECTAATGPGLGVVLLSEAMGIAPPAKADLEIPAAARR